MNARAICKAHFSLPMAVEDAKPLFTPEGERRWAGSSWDPIWSSAELTSSRCQSGHAKG